MNWLKKLWRKLTYRGYGSPNTKVMKWSDQEIHHGGKLAFDPETKVATVLETGWFTFTLGDWSETREYKAGETVKMGKGEG